MRISTVDRLTTYKAFGILEGLKNIVVCSYTVVITIPTFCLQYQPFLFHCIIFPCSYVVR